MSTTVHISFRSVDVCAWKSVSFFLFSFFSFFSTVYISVRYRGYLWGRRRYRDENSSFLSQVASEKSFWTSWVCLNGRNSMKFLKFGERCWFRQEFWWAIKRQRFRESVINIVIENYLFWIFFRRLKGRLDKFEYYLRDNKWIFAFDKFGELSTF